MGSGSLKHSSRRPGGERRERQAGGKTTWSLFPDPQLPFPPTPRVSCLLMPIAAPRVMVLSRSQAGMGKGPLCPGQHQSSAGTATARLPGDEPRGQLSPGHRSMATRRTAQLPGVLPASRSLLNPGHLLHGAPAGQGGRLLSGPASCLLGQIPAGGPRGAGQAEWGQLPTLPTS